MITQKVLFVCLGNICRSPTAEGVFRKLLVSQQEIANFEIDSAGTGDWHVGSPPDRRAQQAARQHGIDISALRGRQVNDSDFDLFDYIIAMDLNNQRTLSALAGDHRQPKVHLFLEFAADYELLEVPDPYYGGDGGFDQVIDMIEQASRGLLAHIQQAR